ncbi:MAG: hypothetical protein KC609_01315 [Myxococcales bacterium]|nr:hypothetical protein [Myxococcales bacterium]
MNQEPSFESRPTSEARAPSPLRVGVVGAPLRRFFACAVLLSSLGLPGCRDRGHPPPDPPLRHGNESSTRGGDIRSPRNPSRRRLQPGLDPQVQEMIERRRQELFRDVIPEVERKELVQQMLSIQEAIQLCFKKHVVVLDLEKLGEGSVSVRALADMKRECESVETLRKRHHITLIGKSEMSDRVLIRLAQFADALDSLFKLCGDLRERSNRPLAVRMVGRMRSIAASVDKQVQTIQKMARYLKRKEVFRSIPRTKRAYKEAFLAIGRQHGRRFQFLMREVEHELRNGVTKQPFNLRTLTQRYLQAKREGELLFRHVMVQTSGDVHFDMRIREKIRSYFDGLSKVLDNVNEILTFLSHDPGWKKTRAQRAYSTLIESYNRWVEINNGIDLQAL